MRTTYRFFAQLLEGSYHGKVIFFCNHKILEGTNVTPNDLNCIKDSHYFDDRCHHSHLQAGDYVTWCTPEDAPKGDALGAAIYLGKDKWHYYRIGHDVDITVSPGILVLVDGYREFEATRSPRLGTRNVKL